jgi:hypothetical protein
MPWWDEPQIGDEIDAIVRDLETVDRVLGRLAPESADWGLADRTSLEIHGRLHDAVDRAEGETGTDHPTLAAPNGVLERAHGAMERSTARRERATKAAAARLRTRRDRQAKVQPIG